VRDYKNVFPGDSMTDPHALDDHFLRDRIFQIIGERGIQVIVETGIWKGDSARWFCNMAPRYVGIDANPQCIEWTNATLNRGGRGNFQLFLGDSPQVLRRIMVDLPVEHTFFFLDAHCYPHPGAPWPLPNEVRAIPRGKGVLCFHDFRVPGKDFGVDIYTVDGVEREFNYDLVKDVLTEWSPGHRVEYMQEADPESSYRGAAFIYSS
jgi:hypothetical protein